MKRERRSGEPPRHPLDWAIAIGLLVVALTLAILFIAARAHGQTVFTFDTIHVPALNTEVDVPVTLTSNNKILGYDLILKFAPSKIRVVNVTAGPAVAGCMFGSGGQADGKGVVLANATGTMRTSIACMQDGVRNGLAFTVRVLVLKVGATLTGIDCRAGTNRAGVSPELPCSFARTAASGALSIVQRIQRKSTRGL